MKNATLSVLMLGSLAMSSAWAVLALSAPTPAAAQDDTDAAEGDTDGETPAEGEATEGETPAEGETPTEGEPAETDELEVDEGHDEIEAPEGLSDAEEANVEAAATVLTDPTAEAAGADADVDEVADDAEDEAEEDAEEAAAPADAPLPWRNTFFSWNHQVTFNSFLRDSQLSYNPNYSQLFSIAPRWYVGPTSWFQIGQTLSLELTDTDGNALNRDPQLTDTIIQFRHMIPWEGFVFLASGRVVLPVSKFSQFAQRYLQTGLGLTVVRPISDANLTLAAVASYRRWWAGSNVARTGDAQPDRCDSAPAPLGATGTAAPQINTSSCDQLGGASTARDVILFGANLVWAPFAGLNFSVSAFGFTTYGHELAPAYINVDTQEEPLQIADGSPSHWNNFTYIAASVGYQFLPWLNISLGIQNSGVVAPLYNPDGGVRNPIFTPDTQVFLSASFQLDEIFTTITGGGEEDLTPEERQRRRQGLASGPTTGGAF